MPKLTQRQVDSIKPHHEKDVFVWDTELTRFGLRVRPWGKRTYIVKYRTSGGRQRKLTIGRAEILTPQEARTIARQKLLEADLGHEQPTKQSTEGLTVAALCERYLADYAEPRKKPKSLRDDRAMIDRIITPALGSFTMTEVSRADISRLHNALRDTSAAFRRLTTRPGR